MIFRLEVGPSVTPKPPSLKTSFAFYTKSEDVHIGRIRPQRYSGARQGQISRLVFSIGIFTPQRPRLGKAEDIPEFYCWDEMVLIDEILELEIHRIIHSDDTAVCSRRHVPLSPDHFLSF